MTLGTNSRPSVGEAEYVAETALRTPGVFGGNSKTSMVIR